MRDTGSSGRDFPAVLQVPKQEHRRELAEQAGHGTLDAQLEKIREMGVEVAEAHLLVGRADEGIVNLAEEISAGLIILGSRGVGLMRRALLGSVSESTMRHAHCPVLVVRQ